MEGRRITMPRMIRYVLKESIGCSRPINRAKSVEVNLSNNIEPIIFPVSWLVTDTLDVICACFSSFLANESSDISCKVTKNIITNKIIANRSLC